MSSSRILIGYIAQATQYHVLCDGDACVVFGSRLKFKSYLAGNPQTCDKSYSIKKAWFEDILTGLSFGAAYAFDEEAFRLFYPLAQRAGLKLPSPDINVPRPPNMPQSALHLMRVQGNSVSKGIKSGR
jgi:hypothetical protein